MAFPNAAQNLAEQHLGLGDLVSLSHHSSFLARSDTNYLEAGIMLWLSSCVCFGSVLAIDGAPIPQHR